MTNSFSTQYVTYKRLCQVAYIPWSRLRCLLTEAVFRIYEGVNVDCDSFTSFTKWGRLVILHSRRHPELYFSSTLQNCTDWRQHGHPLRGSPPEY